jgi:hypothetical protein
LRGGSCAVKEALRLTASPSYSRLDVSIILLEGYEVILVCLFVLQRVMQNPCIASDGYSYERVAIEMWLHENDVSPLTKTRLPDKNLVPNHALLCLINCWKGEAGATGLIR